MHRIKWLVLPLIAIAMFAVACSDDEPESESTPTSTATETTEATETATATETAEAEATISGSLTVYSGRSESLIAPILEQFEAATGVSVEARYGSTAEMAAALLEEGSNSPADVFIAQDPGGLAAVELAGLFAELPADVLDQVDASWRSSQDGWVGLSGRARVLVYNTDLMTEADLPSSVHDLTDEAWKGLVGWAPTNGSFQAFLTAMRVAEGEDAARDWLEAMIANDVAAYGNNRAIVEAVADDEIRVGLVNHYYLHAFKADQGEDFPAGNFHFPDGDIGALVSVAGAGVLNTAQNPDAAIALLNFLLSEDGQRYFADATYEYPVVEGIEPSGDVVPLADIQAPDVDINDLEDLEGTLNLLREVGALE
ncbi:MAG: iron ABC transporter substrate-binding protein [Dehalococcoidia bacterium]|nr:iron ABC transporter substrate-binding protein [Dehalococcoidia bacterium]